jgi:uncharacterized glyoxalase superfamily protein PhnB
MTDFTIQIFVEDLLKVFEHYKKTFNAALLFTAKGSQDELIHLEMDIMGNKITLAPPLQCGVIKGNTIVLCIKFQQEEALMTAYNVLKDGGQADTLKAYPWSTLEGYVTDKFGVMLCIGL